MVEAANYSIPIVTASSEVLIELSFDSGLAIWSSQGEVYCVCGQGWTSIIIIPVFPLLYNYSHAHCLATTNQIALFMNTILVAANRIIFTKPDETYEKSEDHRAIKSTRQ